MKIYDFIHVILAIRFSVIHESFPLCFLWFECGAIKYQNILYKVKVPIISKSIVSWDEGMSNYTTTASTQDSVGCD